MKRLIALLASLMLLTLSALAQSGHSFCTVAADDAAYDLFSVERFEYDDAHRVTAVTGRFERIIIDDDCYAPEYLEGSDTTFPLAEDFTAWMPAGFDEGDKYAAFTDLEAWYIDCYIGRDTYDGHALTFECDSEDGAECDFWFVTVQIELNSDGQITYMEYSYVPWA